MTSRFNTNRKKYVSALTLLVLAVSVFFYGAQPVIASELSSRSTSIGNSKVNQVTTYTINFHTTNVATVGSIVLDFCRNSPLFNLPCTAPTGLNLNSSLLTNQTGLTGFTIDPSSTANKIILTRVASAAPAVTVSYTFSNATNPSQIGSVFVRLSTHTSTDGSGANIDDGAAVFVINEGLGATGYVPPFLTLCVGVTVAQNCSASSGALVTMGELSSSIPKVATTQFSVATNDVLGYVTYVTGTTLTSGNNIIPAAVVPSNSTPGASQFGINLRSNSSPSGGTDPTGAGTGVPTTNYNTSNKFMFSSGDSIASSVNSTDYTRFTVTYLTNISSGQAPGHYTTTMTYIAVVQF